MILNLPKLGNVRFDDDLTPDEFRSQLVQLSKAYDFELPKSDYGYLGSFTRGVSRGTKQLGSTFGDVIPAMLGKSLGFDEFAERQMGEAAETQRQIQETNPAQFESYKDVSGVGEGTRFFLESLGEQVPNIATSLVPGGIGGTLAKRGAVAAAETAAKDAGLTGLEALAGEAAKEAGKKIASRTALGQNIGVALGSYAQNAPEVFQNIYQQTGSLEPGVALLWGAGSAALDSVLPSALLKQLTPAARVGLVEKVLEKSGTDKTLLRSIGVNVLKNAGYEGITEGAQELISESAEKFVAGNPQIFDSKDFDRAMKSAVVGAMVGGAFGPISGAAEYRQDKNEREQAEDLKAVQELQKQQEEEERKAQYYQQYTQQDMLPLSTSVDQAREQQQDTSVQGDLFAGPAGAAAPAIQTQEERREPVTYTGQDQLPFTSTVDDAKAQQLAATGQQDLFGYPAAEQEPIKSLVITPALLSKDLGVGITAGKDTRNKQFGIHDTLVGLDAYDLNQNKIIQRRLQDHFEKYGPKQEKAPVIEAFMSKLKSIETEITPKERVEDGTTDQGLESGAAGASDALPVRSQSGVTEGAGESFGPAMAFGAVDNGPAIGREQGSGASLIDSVEERGVSKYTPEELADPANELTEPKLDVVSKYLDKMESLTSQINELTSTLDKAARTKAGGFRQKEMPLVEKRNKLEKELTEWGNSAQSFAGDPWSDPRTKLGDFISRLKYMYPNPEERFKQTRAYIEELNSRKGTTPEKTPAPETKPLTKKELQQAQGAAQVAISNEPVEDTWDNLSPSVSYNQLPKDLKKQVRDYKKYNALTQETADQVLNSYRASKELEVSRRIRAEDIANKRINASESTAVRKAKETRMEAEGAFESTISPTIKVGDKLVDNPELSLSAFQKQFSEDKTVGQALKRLLKQKKSKNFPGLNIPQKILVNALLKIPGISEMNFGVFKHPDSRRGNKLQRYEEIRGIIGERQVPKTTPVKDANGRVIGESDVFYETEPIYGGEYDEKTNIVKLYQSSSVNTLLHEVVHAATVKVLKNNIINGIGVTPLGKKIMRIYNAAQEAADAKSKRYGLENVYEFIAEAFSSPDFQNFLANQASVTGAKPSLKNKLTSLFNDLFAAIKDMLGVPKAAESLLGDVFDLSSQLFKGPNVELTAAAKVAADLATEPTTHYSMSMPASDTAASIDLMNSPNLVYANLPTFNEGIMGQGKDLVSKLPSSLRKVFLGFTSLGDLDEMYGKIMPSIKNLDTQLKLRGYTHKNYKDAIDHIANKGVKALKGKSPAIVKRFNFVAHELSRLNIDPRPGKGNDNHPMVQAWKALPADLQKAGIDVVESYESMVDQMIDFLAESSPGSGKALREKFESKKLPFYFPFLRQGNYWIQFTDGNNETVSLAYDNPRQQKLMHDYLKSKGAKDLRAFSRIDQITRASAPPVGFMADIVKIMEQGGASPEVIEKAYQSYITLFPAESLRQQFRQREGTLGFTGDVIQGYATVAPKMATQLANLKHGPDIDKAYSDVENEARNNATGVAADVMSELSKRRDFFANPIASSWVYGASGANFFYSIAGNISSALVNLSILPTIVLPQLAINPVTGKYEYGKALSALNEARGLFYKGGKDKSREFFPIRTFGENTKLPDDLKALYDHAIKMGTIQYSIGRDLNDISKAPSGQYSDSMHKVNTFLGYSFEYTERFNREVTLIAAYKLAKANGMDTNAAIDHAVRFTTKIHTEAVPESGARFLQAGLPKVMLIFKRFAMAQIFNVYTLFNAAKNGMSPMEKKVARRQLIGIYGMNFALAGLQGVPLYGAVQVLANMLLADDDEPYDLDQEIRESFGMLGYKGPANMIFGFDIASRTGFNGMVWRDDPKRLAEVGFASYFIEHLFGPTFSTGRTVLQDGPAMIANGQWERGLEKMVPSFIKNPLKALRFATEGAKNPNGAPLVDDVSGYNQFMQIWGFTPRNISEAYIEGSFKKQVDLKLLNRRDGLLDALYLAKSNGDVDSEDKIYEKIERFNEKNPSRPYVITNSGINTSMKVREKAINDSVNGVYISPRALQAIEAKYGN
jgi:hypothetical protein